MKWKQLSSGKLKNRTAFKLLNIFLGINDLNIYVGNVLFRVACEIRINIRGMEQDAFKKLLDFYQLTIYIIKFNNSV